MSKPNSEIQLHLEFTLSVSYAPQTCFINTNNSFFKWFLYFDIRKSVYEQSLNHLDIQLILTETHLPHTETHLPLTESSFPLTEMYLPYTEAIFPLTEILLPLTEILLPLTEIFLPLTEILLPPTETFLPYSDTNKSHSDATDYPLAILLINLENL